MCWPEKSFAGLTRPSVALTGLCVALKGSFADMPGPCLAKKACVGLGGSCVGLGRSCVGLGRSCVGPGDPYVGLVDPFVGLSIPERAMC